MHFHYQRFPVSEKEDGLPAIIKEIVYLINPVRIYLTGISHEYRLTESIFIKNPRVDQSMDGYNLLIVHNGEDKGSGVEMETRLQTRLHHHAGLNLRLIDILEFNRAVKAGHEFENFILLNAMIYYDDERTQVEDPVRPEI
jgi:hypothetical protein